MLEQDRIEGTVQKYLREVTLLGQVFVKAEDGKTDDRTAIESQEAPASAGSSCTSWARGSKESKPISPPKSPQWRRRARERQFNAR